MLYRFFIIIMLVISQNTWATCTISTSSGKPFVPTNDALVILLFSETNCSQNVFEFRQLIKKFDLKIETTMVANRGFHNPSRGSFSIFEMISGQIKSQNNTLVISNGDFFFGHFTKISEDGFLVANQNPKQNSLMIEALAWDPKKELYNFYELRGDGKQGQWFYRGDSADIFADNQFLHRQPDPAHPQFGRQLRCSACHDAGGPIMKELSEPHNDWWEPKRKLDFGGRQPDKTLREILETLVPADRLAKAVALGSKKLEESSSFHQKKSSLSLQEQLRPLFCPVELNFMSDVTSNDEKKFEIAIPVDFFMDSRFLPAEVKKVISISRDHYESVLSQIGSHFPETQLADTDHAWLTPVKANSDHVAINELIKSGMINEKFMFDVLDIDMTNPVFSSVRCSLLRYLPNTATRDWYEVFIKNLTQSQEPAAKQLRENLKDSHRTPEFYQRKAETFLEQCKLKLRKKENVEKMVLLLAQRRAEIRVSEISRNPLGQILEPGFRVIFPENKIVTPIPGKLKLTAECDVISSS